MQAVTVETLNLPPDKQAAKPAKPDPDPWPADAFQPGTPVLLKQTHPTVYGVVIPPGLDAAGMLHVDKASGAVAVPVAEVAPGGFVTSGSVKAGDVRWLAGKTAEYSGPVIVLKAGKQVTYRVPGNPAEYTVPQVKFAAASSGGGR